jgi:hypothetical protein
MTDKDRIKELETELANYRESPYAKMYFGLKKQWDNVAGQLNDDITVSFTDEGDLFDRFMDTMDKLKKMGENLEWLRKKVGLEGDDKNQEKRPVNPLEQRAEKR